MAFLPTTDPQLVADLKDWSADASWQRFFREYGPKIQALALRSGLPPEDADEVVQETMLKVARHLPSFEYDRELCRFRTWLNQIVNQRILACLKRKQRRLLTEATLTALAEVCPAAAGVSNSPQSENDVALLESALSRVRASVPPRHWQIFESYVLHGLPVAEVARIHGTSSANVYLLRHRLAKRLQEEVDRVLDRPF
jgi:RNA polymerase sigma-70 factor (ECF subfamily)